MVTASEYINTTITGNATIAAALTNGFYWELAPEDTATPFATYRIIENPARTKSFSGAYEVSVFVWDATLRAAATVADTIKAEVPQAWRYTQGRSGYTSTDAKEAYIELLFTFNI